MVQALLERVPTLRLAVSATTRARRPERGATASTTGSSPTRSSTAGSRPATSSSTTSFPWGQRSGTLALRARPDRGAGRRAAARARARGALDGQGQGCPARSRSSSTRRSTSSSAGCAGGRPRARARSTSGSRSRPSRRSSPAQFDYVVENDDRERAADECVAIVERELQLCRYHGRVDDSSSHRSAARPGGLALRARDRRGQAGAADQQLPPPARRRHLRRVRAAARPVALEELLDACPSKKSPRARSSTSTPASSQGEPPVSRTDPFRHLASRCGRARAKPALAALCVQ